MEKIKTLFIGTSEFAATILDTLLSHESIHLIGVVTQPDKPLGRKQILTPTPVRKYLLGNGVQIPVETPERIKLMSSEILEKYKPELIIVAAYGQIIPKNILDYPKYGCFNIHGSLLPELRGAVPVHMAILLGLKTTGVTLQRMVMAMDAGNIVLKKEINISEDETTESLMMKLAKLGSDLIQEFVPKLISGNLEEKEQDENEATFCYQSDILKEKAEITFETDVKASERMVRAFYPWPIAWIKLNDGKILKIYKANLHKEGLSGQNTLSLKREGNKLLLYLRNGVLELLEVQLEGKKRDTAKNYFYLAEKKQ
jgi:methionyl-tRNA formyltransferase